MTAEQKREYRREYMRRYRAEHPEYRKRNTEKCNQNKKADWEKWQAYYREYNKRYREERKGK